MRKLIITDEEYQAVKEAAKANQNKRLDKKLQAIMMRYEGKSNEEIHQKLDITAKGISVMICKFKRVGIEEYTRNKYGGNHRSLTDAEEKEILDSFEAKALAGEVVTVQDIKRAFDARIGKDTGSGYIYMLLNRRNWRKVMPRPKHPKKASEAEIEASKKLTTPE
jgi:hypothetical protein